MNINAYREELRLKLTGGLLELELSDTAIDSILNSALRELRRYIDSTRLITVPFSRCIHLSDVKDAQGDFIKVSSVSRIYRAEGIGDFQNQTHRQKQSDYTHLFLVLVFQCHLSQACEIVYYSKLHSAKHSL